jgi:hypothetical protein
MKAILTGADGVQLVSEILQHGFVRLTKVRQQMCDWLAERGYHSIAQVRDSMNITQAPSVEGYRRTQYLHVLHSYPVIREWGLR